MRAVIYIIDDMGWDPQCYGGEAIMPAYDAVAAAGIRYTRAFSGGNVCAPGRAAIQTGRTPVRTYVSANGKKIASGERTIAHLLGGASAFFGKWHLGKTPGSRPAQMGYAESPAWLDGHFDGDVKFCVGDSSTPTLQTYGDSTLVLADLAVAWLDAHADDDFLLVVCPTSGHTPYTAGQKWLNLYDTANPHRAYLAELSCADDGLKRIRQKLTDLDLLDGTLLWVCGDNGGVLRTGPDGWGKTDPGARASLVISGLPGVTPGTVSDAPAYAHQDLLPTLAALAGLSPEQPVLDGQDIRDARGGPLYFAQVNPTTGVWTSLKSSSADGAWKYKADPDPSKDRLWYTPTSETVNVLAQNQALGAQLRAEVIAWFTSGPPGAGVYASWTGADY